jgi:hypothetical protein
MRDEAFRLEQQRDRYASHVKPVNEFVDALRDQDGRGWLPYVAPCHGGVDARVLSILRDPGPMTQDGVGSGFLCIENDDPTAERQCRAFADVGVGLGDITPWNAYPWYINRKPTSREREAGIEPLRRLLALLPRLRVVFLQGGDAQTVWRAFARRHSVLAQDLRFEVVESYHPGLQALWTNDPAERETRVAVRARAYQRVGELLRS